MQLLRVNRLVVAAGRVTAGLRVEEQEDERKVSTALLTGNEGAEVLKSAEDNVVMNFPDSDSFNEPRSRAAGGCVVSTAATASDI